MRRMADQRQDERPAWRKGPVLILDAQFAVAHDMAEILQLAGAPATTIATSLAEARAITDRTEPGLAILDLAIDRAAGLDLASCLALRGVPVLLVTGDDQPVAGRPAHAFVMVPKPVPEVALLRAIRHLLG